MGTIVLVVQKRGYKYYLNIGIWTIDVYVEDSFGKVQQLTFSFNNEREEGKDKPASSRH